MQTKSRPIELLSPAKDLNCGIEAINHGADAVYIGAPKFGARAAAGNSLEDIRELCEYAHLYGARIYVTLNTILKEDELEEAERMPFIKGGHSYAIRLDDGEEQIVNYNSDLTWANCYSKMYPAGAARVIESKVTFPDVTLEAGVHTLTIRPLSPAVVLHKIIVDCGGDMSGRLNLMESPRTRTLK